MGIMIIVDYCNKVSYLAFQFQANTQNLSFSYLAFQFQANTQNSSYQTFTEAFNETEWSSQIRWQDCLTNLLLCT